MNKTRSNYPKGKIINQYAQFGGALGGTFLWLTIAVPDVLFNDHDFGAPEVLNITNVYLITVFNIVWLLGFALIFYVVFGFILGLLPSLFTGWILAQVNAYRNYKGLLISLITGGFMGFAFLSATELPFIIQVLTGGVSALILALFALPKA
ncbi:hypothetical protein ACT3TI_02470 [Psychrobacter sp. AOP22-C1-22]|uniref:hypothetical protein n=1 Tax=unclassified Psychrobacter TaxID=196806 RepID=UPI001787C101|nr:hypothetical protein [Psychrobacter sp. FME6]MBE0405729.1 hypothetical protein [Psychrobacter sp. FME6]